MKYYRFEVNTQFSGTENDYYAVFLDDVTEDILEDTGHEFAKDNATSFEYLLFGWDYDPVAEGDMTEEEYEKVLDWYYQNAEYYYEEISQEEYENNH